MSIEFYIGCIGMVFILKYGSILNPVRDILTKVNFFRDLFKCSLCLGFWVGVLWTVIYKQSYITPFTVAGICWTADIILQFIQAIDMWVMSKVNDPKL